MHIGEEQEQFEILPEDDPPLVLPSARRTTPGGGGVSHAAPAAPELVVGAGAAIASGASPVIG